MNNSAEHRVLPRTLREALLVPDLLANFDVFLPPMPESHKGWHYMDFQTMPVPIWIELLELIGDLEYRALAMTTRKHDGIETRRGQFWISPLAKERIDNYLAENLS